MKHPHLLLAAASLAAAAGCAQTAPAAPPMPDPPAPPVLAPGECDAEAARYAIGRPFDQALAEEARSRSHAERLRIVRPGQMVTMDFDARRLTMEVDDQGRIVRARCG